MLDRLVAAFNAEGFSGVLPFVDPEFEFHEPPEQLGTGVFRGRENARDGFARWSEAWVEQQSEPRSVELLPDGRILAFSRERLVGRNGVRVENDCGHVFTFRNGKVLRWQVFWDPANARAAAGAG